MKQLVTMGMLLVGLAGGINAHAANYDEGMVCSPATEEAVAGLIYEAHEADACLASSQQTPTDEEGGLVKYRWKCYAHPCDKEKLSASPLSICKDHAQKAALAVCRKLAKDADERAQCKLAGEDGQGMCCQVPVKN